VLKTALNTNQPIWWCLCTEARDSSDQWEQSECWSDRHSCIQCL